jgi:hypothetical protein
MPDSDELLRRLHDTYHAGPEADIHQAQHGLVFSDAQPGSPDFARAHLVGSSAPEPHIERWDGIGPEGFGPVEILDGRTGRSIARLNAHARRRLMGA